MLDFPGCNFACTGFWVGNPPIPIYDRDTYWVRLSCFQPRDLDLYYHWAYYLKLIRKPWRFGPLQHVFFLQACSNAKVHLHSCRDFFSRVWRLETIWHISTFESTKDKTRPKTKGSGLVFQVYHKYIYNIYTYIYLRYIHLETHVYTFR